MLGEIAILKENINFETANKIDEFANYPIECFYRDDYAYGDCSILHWHFYSELIYVNDGAQEITVGNNIVRINKGDLIYINPQQIHLAYSCSKNKTALTVVKFDPSILKSAVENTTEIRQLAPFLENTAIQNLVFKSTQIGNANINEMLSELINEQNGKAYSYEYAMRNIICNIITALMRSLNQDERMIFSNNGIEEDELKKFNMVIEYLNKNFQIEIAIDDVLKICNLSYSNFALKFKMLTGKTLTEYINHIRVAYAQQLLSGTVESITKIASSCGFNDVCYFSRVFKSLTGMSPLKFRKNAILT